MRPTATAATFAAAIFLLPFEAHADAVVDWNVRANEIVVESKLGTPPAMRVMAIVQAAVQEAVTLSARGSSIDAAVAAANRVTLSKLLPAQQATIERAYLDMVASIPAGAAKSSGIVLGERAAAAVLAARADDGASTPVAYRPYTTAGVYVPTSAVAVPHWGARKPWLMKTGAAFRPSAPPTLGGDAWTRDYAEVKRLGAKASAARTPEQTEIAQFWEYSMPGIYHGVLRSVAAMPGRSSAENARLFAAATQAMDDALIAVFDAKYHYNFWRPVTAVRNADMDGNAATEPEAAWTPLLEAPLHPEYPSGHAILAGAMGAVLEAELAGTPSYVLSTSSPSAKNMTRRWTRVGDFVQEVCEARIHAGIHFRSAVEIGAAMGRDIGLLAANKHLAP